MLNSSGLFKGGRLDLLGPSLRRCGYPPRRSNSLRLNAKLGLHSLDQEVSTRNGRGTGQPPAMISEYPTLLAVLLLSTVRRIEMA